MKKYFSFLLSLIVLVCCCISPTYVHAADDNNLTKKVYLVKVYRKDPWMGNYVLTQLGSAVGVSDHKIVTNAHVIFNADTQEPYQYIEVCETASSKKSPRCFDTADIVSYDTDNDLALLELSKPVSISVLASIEPKIQQKVSIVGYPNNGGNTITITQGIVAGYEDGHYKIDANIDHGNSGGGSYNEQGELVGIPVFYRDGGTALGYMIPASVVKKFVSSNKKSQATHSVDPGFASFVQSARSSIKKQVITNPFFALKLKNSGFELISEAKEISGAIASYTLKHKDNKSYLTISVGASDTLEFDSEGHNEAMEQFKDDFTSILYESGTTNNQFREYAKFSKSKSDKITSILAYNRNLTIHNDIQFRLISQSVSSTAEKDFKKLINALQTKNTPDQVPDQTISTISLAKPTYNTVRKHYNISDYGVKTITFDLKGKYSNASLDLSIIDDEYRKQNQKKNLQSFADQIISSLTGSLSTIIQEGFVSAGNTKRYIIISTCQECESHRVWAYSFVINPQDKKNYLVAIEFKHNIKNMSTTDTNAILDYISQIAFDSTIDYKTDNIKRQSFEEFKKK